MNFLLRLFLLTDNFFEDYPDITGQSTLIPEGAADQGQKLWNFLYGNLKYVWALLFGFTLISTVVALVRLVISADDIPHKKSRAKSDLAAALIMLAIMGGTPIIGWLIISLLNIIL